MQTTEHGTEEGAQETPVLEPVMEENGNVVIGKVGNYFVPFYLDSGADECVVPEELVHEEEKLAERVWIRDVSGKKTERQRAKILMSIGDRHWHHKVALQPSSTLHGMVIFALDLKSDEDRALVEEHMPIRRKGKT